MKQPEGFPSSDGEQLVCKLKKSIYSLKQASHQWHLKFHNIISSFGFEENVMDQAYTLRSVGVKFVFLFYTWMTPYLQPMIRVYFMR